MQSNGLCGNPIYMRKAGLLSFRYRLYPSDLTDCVRVVENEYLPPVMMPTS